MRNELIRKLRQHNRWRRGADVKMMHPKEIRQMLDDCVKILENMSDEQFNGMFYGKKNN